MLYRVIVQIIRKSIIFPEYPSFSERLAIFRQTSLERSPLTPFNYCVLHLKFETVRRTSNSNSMSRDDVKRQMQQDSYVRNTESRCKYTMRVKGTYHEYLSAQFARSTITQPSYSLSECATQLDGDVVRLYLSEFDRNDPRKRCFGRIKYF